MIGVFDSGLGGLTIYRALVKKLPVYRYLYLGDNAHLPYGSRSNEIIYRYTERAVDFMFKKGCYLIILACNTSSAVALRPLQKNYLVRHYPQRRLLGVLIPAAEEAARKTRNKRVGIIGTEATINSHTFRAEILKLDPQIKVWERACPLLVPIIEAGEFNWRGLDDILKKYLTPLKEQKIDTLVLGCTHYALIKEKIKKVMGPKVKLISEDEIIAPKLKNYLARHPEIERHLKKGGKNEQWVTAYSQRFNEISRLFMKESLPFKLTDLSL